jgi:ribonuclease HII
MLLAGVDEAGRGPWAGPVVAAAVILDPARPIAGLADSKTLSAAARDKLAALIRTQALAFAIAEASVEEIDALNILRANDLAMRRALRALSPQAARAIIDGNRVPPDLPCPAEAIVKADARVAAVAAASILAKTHRDALMTKAEGMFPGYGFARHKGYGVAAHAAALARLGACDLHRKSFKPVAEAIARLGR